MDVAVVGSQGPYWIVRAIARTLKWLFFSLLAKKIFEFLVF